MNDTVDISKKQTKVRKRKKRRKAVESKKDIKTSEDLLIFQLIEFSQF